MAILWLAAGVALLGRLLVGGAVTAGKMLPDSGVIAYMSIQEGNPTEIFGVDVRRRLFLNLSKYPGVDNIPPGRPMDKRLPLAPRATATANSISCTRMAAMCDG
jgi:hypothetical protein